MFSNNKPINVAADRSDHNRKDLRDALAASRAVQLVDELDKRRITFKHSSDAADSLQELYYHLHGSLFQDWEGQNRESEAVDARHVREGCLKREAIREAFVALTNTSGLFDKNGAFAHHNAEEMAGILAGFYRNLQEVHPFPYGNTLTLDVFMVALGNMPGFHELYPNGIDFTHRLLQTEELKTLHDPRAEMGELQQLFLKALQPTLQKTRGEEKPHPVFNDAVIYISGIRFLGHKEPQPDGGEKQYLVTINGGLVPCTPQLKEDIKHKIIDKALHVAELPSFRPDKFLSGTEHLRGRRTIDGIPVGEDGAAPLFCLETNILTGLRNNSEEQLEELIRQNAPAGTTLFDLVKPENTTLVEKLYQQVEEQGDIRLKGVLDIAVKRLGLMSRKLEQDAAEELAKGQSVEHPQFFMSFGGAGCGKSSVEHIANHLSGDNMVVASLDGFRSKSDLYSVMVAAGHHSDDYEYVNPYAKELRDRVTKLAREQKKNLFYDGSGIQYAGRFDKLVAIFKEEGYGTQLLGVDGMLFAPVGREEEFRYPVLQRVWDRASPEKGANARAMPWNLVKEKHVQAANSFLEAARDNGLDKACLYSSDGAEGKNYLIAESFVVDEPDLRALKRHTSQGTVARHFQEMLKGEKSALHDYASAYQSNIEDCIQMIPTYKQAPSLASAKEDNVAYLVSRKEGKSRILAVYDKRRYIDFVNKSLLNPSAQGEVGMNEVPVSAGFYINPENPGKVAWQGAEVSAPAVRQGYSR